MAEDGGLLERMRYYWEMRQAEALQAQWRLPTREEYQAFAQGQEESVQHWTPDEVAEQVLTLPQMEALEQQQSGFTVGEDVDDGQTFATVEEAAAWRFDGPEVYTSHDAYRDGLATSEEDEFQQHVDQTEGAEDLAAYAEDDDFAYCECPRQVPAFDNGAVEIDTSNTEIEPSFQALLDRLDRSLDALTEMVDDLRSDYRNARDDDRHYSHEGME